MSEKEMFDLRTSDIDIDNEIMDTFKTIKLLKRSSFDLQIPASIYNKEAEVDAEEDKKPLEKIDEKPKRECTCFKKGTVAGAVFNLCSATLGAGLVSMPYAIAQTGMTLGIIFSLLAMISTIYSINMLCRARSVTGAVSYEQLCQMTIGKIGVYLLSVSLFIFCYGACIAYLIAVGDLLTPVLSYHGLESPIINRTTITILFWLLLMLPLSFYQNIDKLSFTSSIALIGCIYFTFSVIIYALYYHPTDGYNTVKWFNISSVSSITALPIILFSFTCQVNTFQIQSELSRPIESEMRKVNVYALFLCFFALVATGMFGYWAFPTDTNGDILLMMKIPSHPFIMTIIISLAYILLGANVILSFPLNILPIRFTLMFLYKDGVDVNENTKLPVKVNVALSFLLCFSSLLIAIFFQDISKIFELLGGIPSALISLILPPWTIINLYRGGATIFTKKDICLASTMIIVGVIVGVLSTVLSIVYF